MKLTNRLIYFICLALLLTLICSCGSGSLQAGADTMEPTATAAPSATPPPTPAPTPEPTPTPEPEETGIPEGAPVYQINCGGTETVEGFAKDYKYWAGSTSANWKGYEIVEDLLEFINIPADLPDPAPLLVYNSCRWVGAGFFGYRFDELEPGRGYTIRMHFLTMAEDQTIPFIDVAINGETILEYFDLNEWVRSVYDVYVEELPAAADEDGKIAIDFIHKKGNAVFISAIELLAGEPLPG